jgi:hypothetical protein
MVTEKMDEQGYSNLLTSLEDGTCALILGPEFFLLDKPDCSSFRDNIFKNRLSKSPYLEEDGFFNTQKLSRQGLEDKTTILTNIKDYFKDMAVPEYYKKVAQLPFSLGISLSPDDLMAKAMTTAQRPYHFSYYKKGSGLYMREVNKNTGQLKWQSRDIKTEEMQSDDAFLFNFLGVYSDTDSLIFTYDVFFEFLYDIFLFINNELSNNLRTTINKARCFLFLGFGYDKWYLKLIFFTLEKILKTQKSLKGIIINYTEKQDNTVQFYENQFQLNFFKEGTVEFINKLYDDCKAKDILKNPAPPGVSLPNTPSKYKILFFAANPNSLLPLNHVAEFEKIKEAYVHLSNVKRDAFDLPPMQQATRQKNMLLTIKPEKPGLVIISMHGTQDTGLLFQGENGEKAPLSLPEFLKDIQVLTQDPLNRLECIVLSCCHSADFAKQVCQFIPYAIGIRGAIQDEAMPEFMEGFSSSLFADGNMQQAYIMGKHLVERNNELKENASLIEFYTRQ